MSDQFDPSRRMFLGAGLATATGASFAGAGPSSAQTGSKGVRSFAPLKHVDAGVLRVGYAEAGPPDGPPVLLLHGWPYDIHTYAEVAPLLAADGFRVIIPYLRGYGPTRFLSPDTPRNGQQSALAMDVIALIDALRIGHP